MNMDTSRLIAFAREALGLATTDDLLVTALGGRGSDRTYFRVTRGPARAAILVEYDARRVENGFFAEIALFLDGIGVPVPRIMRHDPAARLVLMEDLGDVDLWALREAPWDTRSALYQKTLEIVDRLHAFPAGSFPSDRVRLMEPFDRDLYRWEGEYFKEHFVKALCDLRLESSFAVELEEELLRLARSVLETGRSLVHRDLQSQNVMIRDEAPVLIDFQGMRFGSLFYDLGSLLCDPYVRFSDAEIKSLLSFYYSLSKRGQDREDFECRFWAASAQRLMQALGAYGFLGLTRGLTAYLEHVPAGLRNLTRAARNAASLPRLVELCERCRTALGHRTVG
jgi:aminoglycoside/choline kinase family phosphotransferase